MKIKAFYLDRIIDDSGVSGLGKVAIGLVIDSELTILRWIVGDVRSTVLYKNPEEVIKIHGHSNHTQIKWVGDLEI